MFFDLKSKAQEKIFLLQKGSLSISAVYGYDYIGIGRDDGDKGSEHEAIFYK